MNYSTAVFLINKSVRAIAVSYEPDPASPDKAKGGQTYTFKTFDTEVAVKDLVIIPTDTRWGMTIGRVEAVDVDIDLDSVAIIKWLVGRVDQANYNLAIKQEDQAISAIRSAEIRKKRDDLAKALFADNEALLGLPIATTGGAPAIEAAPVYTAPKPEAFPEEPF